MMIYDEVLMHSLSAFFYHTLPQDYDIVLFYQFSLAALSHSHDAILRYSLYIEPVYDGNSPLLRAGYCRVLSSRLCAALPG